MRDLSVVARQLRAVQQARRQFLQLWAMEQAVIVPALDRVVEDLELAMACDPAMDDPDSAEPHC